MAKNGQVGDGHRDGAVRKRSQYDTKEGVWIKRDAGSGKFMKQKHTGKKFKGVRTENK